MKKIMFGFVIFMLSGFLFGAEIKSYVSVSYKFGLFTERGDDATTKLLSHGFDFSVSGYFNKNWGIYLNTDYSFPTESTVTSGGVSVTATSSDWDFSIIMSVILGPTYKYNINENFELFGAIGFHFAYYSMTTSYIVALSSSFGLGGDFGIRYLPTKNFYLTVGSLFSHDFFNTAEITTSYGTTKDFGYYNFGSIRPYIGIGFTFNETIK